MIKKFCLIFLAFVALNTFAQEGTSSPYSFYGIGSLKFKGTVENRSMGGLSIYADSIHVNLRNPASYGGLNLQIYNNEGRPITFAVGGSHSDIKLQTDGDSDRTSATSFDYLALSIPAGKLGFGFGILPYTSVGYKLEAEETILDSTVVSNRYNGDGGLNKAYLGIGYQIAKNLRIGVDASYNFGKVTNSSIDFLYDDEGELLQYQTKETSTSELSGINLNFGVIYNPMINDKLQLTSALTYTPKSELTSNNERVFQTIVINPFTGQEGVVNELETDLTALNLKETTLTLPQRTTFGLGIGEPRKWFLGGEYTFVKTSQFANPIFSINNATFEDASTFSFGGFYVPDYSSFNKYFKRVVYRAGVRFENTGLRINEQSINEFGISFGVGLPVGNMFSNANLGFEIGRRGTTDQNLIQENFINFQISLSLNDRWFVKPKFN